jgi:hypothetical protein
MTPENAAMSGQRAAEKAAIAAQFAGNVFRAGLREESQNSLYFMLPIECCISLKLGLNTGILTQPLSP